jgi:hypothetical protein
MRCAKNMPRHPPVRTPLGDRHTVSLLGIGGSGCVMDSVLWRLVEYSSTPVGTFGTSCVVHGTDRSARNVKLPALQIACTIDNHISLIYDNPNPPLPPHPPATPPTPPRAAAGAAVHGSAPPAASPNVIHPSAQRHPSVQNACRAAPGRAVLCRYGRGRVTHPSLISAAIMRGRCRCLSRTVIAMLRLLPCLAELQRRLPCAIMLYRPSSRSRSTLPPAPTAKRGPTPTRPSICMNLTSPPARAARLP